MIAVILLLEPGASAGDFETLGDRIVSSDDDVGAVFREDHPTIWIVPDARSIESLMRIGGGRRGDQRLLLLAPVDADTSTALQALFTHVVSPPEGGHLLPPKELAGVLSNPDPGESFIGGYVHHTAGMVVLYRGDLSALVVPLEWFHNPNTVKANPHDFEIVDWGHGVRLGEFEAATDAVLYDFDPVVRAKLAEQDRINLAEERRILSERGSVSAAR